MDYERQEATKAVLNFMKKLYCVDRSVSREILTPGGESMELYHAVSSALICFALIQENYNEAEALDLERRLINSIKGNRPERFVKGIQIIKESRSKTNED